MITANERGRVGVKLDRVTNKLNKCIDILNDNPDLELTNEQVANLLIEIKKLLKKEFAYTTYANPKNK